MSITSALIAENERKYRKYIDEHKLNVKKAWDYMRQNPKCLDYISSTIIDTNIISVINLVNDLVNNHDYSKYGPEEFDAYRKNFYPISPEEKDENKEAFEKAWHHHYTNNMHHWDWWYESGNADNMPLVYVIEMVCDWEAMGYKFGNSSKQWYENNKQNIHLGEKQRIFAENLMNLICQ